MQNNKNRMQKELFLFLWSLNYFGKTKQDFLKAYFWIR